MFILVEETNLQDKLETLFIVYGFYLHKVKKILLLKFSFKNNETFNTKYFMSTLLF